MSQNQRHNWNRIAFLSIIVFVSTMTFFGWLADQQAKASSKNFQGIIEIKTPNNCLNNQSITSFNNTTETFDCGSSNIPLYYKMQCDYGFIICLHSHVEPFKENKA